MYHLIFTFIFLCVSYVSYKLNLLDRLMSKNFAEIKVKHLQVKHHVPQKIFHLRDNASLAFYTFVWTGYKFSLEHGNLTWCESQQSRYLSGYGFGALSLLIVLVLNNTVWSSLGWRLLSLLAQAGVLLNSGLGTPC